MDNIFADRLGNITVSAGVARMEFLVVKALNKKEEQVELESAFRLHMPMEGVMQTIEALEQMKAELIEQVNAKQATDKNKA